MSEYSPMSVCLRDTVIPIAALSFLSAALLSGCAAKEDEERVSYYDKNGDDRVDLERHVYTQTDSDWELRDTDFDGRYDRKVSLGGTRYIDVDGTEGRRVDLPVPAGVRIEK